MREFTNTENFLDVVKEKKICIVDFFAPWCGPCKKLAPILEKIGEDFSDDLFVLKVNVDDFDDLAVIHNVSAMPTLVFYLNGELTSHLVKGFSAGTEEVVRNTVKKLTT
jgi:thioredoxin 1